MRRLLFCNWVAHYRFRQFFRFCFGPYNASLLSLMVQYVGTGMRDLCKGMTVLAGACTTHAEANALLYC